MLFKKHPEWVSEANYTNPERGDYETLVVSRSVLSGSAKLTPNEATMKRLSFQGAS